MGKIHNEDCFKTMGSMGDDSVDLIITSPPWNASKNYGDFNSDNYEDYPAFINKLCGELERIAKVAVYVFISQTYMFEVQHALKGFIQWVFYHRRNFGTHRYIRMPWIKTITPIAMSFPNGKVPMVNKVQGLKTMDLITGVNPQSDFIHNKRVHPAQDPVEAYIPLIARTPCETVYDPFMGSGTLAIAAIQLGKQFIGSELNPEYVEMAEKRIVRETQQENLFDK